MAYDALQSAQAVADAALDDLDTAVEAALGGVEVGRFALHDAEAGAALDEAAVSAVSAIDAVYEVLAAEGDRLDASARDDLKDLAEARAGLHESQDVATFSTWAVAVEILLNDGFDPFHDGYDVLGDARTVVRGAHAALGSLGAAAETALDGVDVGRFVVHDPGVGAVLDDAVAAAVAALDAAQTAVADAAEVPLFVDVGSKVHA